jgi:hypothetical protein
VSPFRHPPTDLFIVFIVLVERKQSKVFIQAVLNVQQGMAQAGSPGHGALRLRVELEGTPTARKPTLGRTQKTNTPPILHQDGPL